MYMVVTKVCIHAELDSMTLGTFNLGTLCTIAKGQEAVNFHQSNYKNPKILIGGNRRPLDLWPNSVKRPLNHYCTFLGMSEKSQNGHAFYMYGSIFEHDLRIRY